MSQRTPGAPDADDNFDELTARLKQARREMGAAKAEAARLQKQLVAERASWEFGMRQEHGKAVNYEQRIQALAANVHALTERNAALSIENGRIKDTCALNERRLRNEFLEEVKLLRNELLEQDKEIAVLKQQARHGPLS